MAWSQTAKESRAFSTSPQAKIPPVRSQSSAFPSATTGPGAGRTCRSRCSVSAAGAEPGAADRTKSARPAAAKGTRFMPPPGIGTTDEHRYVVRILIRVHPCPSVVPFLVDVRRADAEGRAGELEDAA